MGTLTHTDTPTLTPLYHVARITSTVKEGDSLVLLLSGFEGKEGGRRACLVGGRKKGTSDTSTRPQEKRKKKKACGAEKWPKTLRKPDALSIVNWGSFLLMSAQSVPPTEKRK